MTEALAGHGEEDHRRYTYNANGQPETVTHPDQYSKYTYDLRDLVKTVSNGKSRHGRRRRRSPTYTYTDRGQKLKETKANGNTVDYTYYLDGALKSHDGEEAERHDAGRRRTPTPTTPTATRRRTSRRR